MKQDNLIKNLKENEYILIKSKDDLTFEHNKNTPLYKMTGFSGTAGEAIIDTTGKIILFVDPRYHQQADSETRGRNVNVIKLDMGTNLILALKKTLPKGSTLYVPSKSTKYAIFNLFQKTLTKINIAPYDTEDEPETKAAVEEVSLDICGVSYNRKIDKLKRAVKGQSIFVSSLEDVSYLLNLRSYDIANTSVIKAKMLILNDKSIIFTDSKIPKLRNVEVQPFNKMKSIFAKIDEPVLIDKNTISLNDFNLIKTPKFMLSNPAAKMASTKNKAEINHYKEAFKKLDSALYAFREKIKPGLSEFELKELFEEELIKKGAKCTSFKTILAIGENSSSIHYSNYDKNKILKEGDIILLDCGGYYEGGYATDITRVFFCKGKISDKVKEIYTAVLKAQLNCYFTDFEMTGELDFCARKILKKYEKQEFLFPHSLGHGVGIPVHQAPPTLTLNPKYNKKLKNNMVFTIEPGLYKMGTTKTDDFGSEFGIRLENTVYFNNGKKITLSKFPYEEDLIDKNKLTKKEQNWLQIWQDMAKDEQGNTLGEK